MKILHRFILPFWSIYVDFFYFNHWWLELRSCWLFRCLVLTLFQSCLRVLLFCQTTCLLLLPCSWWFSITGLNQLVWRVFRVFMFSRRFLERSFRLRQVLCTLRLFKCHSIIFLWACWFSRWFFGFYLRQRPWCHLCCRFWTLLFPRG